jgi:hypothetical protein
MSSEGKKQNDGSAETTTATTATPTTTPTTTSTTTTTAATTDLNCQNELRFRENLYRLIISQLFYDGYQHIAVGLSGVVQVRLFLHFILFIEKKLLIVVNSSKSQIHLVRHPIGFLIWLNWAQNTSHSRVTTQQRLRPPKEQQPIVVPQMRTIWIRVFPNVSEPTIWSRTRAQASILTTNRTKYQQLPTRLNTRRAM